MQVFLPYPDFAQSVACLDDRRLGNQIYRECLTLIRGGWPNHPAAKIWASHTHSLADYALCGLQELEQRGRFYPYWIEYFSFLYNNSPNTGFPSLVGHEPFHAAMRSQLLSKDPQWYSQFGWTEPPGELPYVWRHQ